MTKSASKSVKLTKPVKGLKHAKPAASRKVQGIESARSVDFKVVQKAYDLGPIFVQRDHEARAKKVKYLKGSLHGDQLVFHLVRINGKLRLIDGYTRVKCVMMDKVEIPARVLVIIHAEPASEDALKALYDQFNSPAARKGASCRYSEGQRATDTLNTYNSPLMQRLQKTAPMWSVNGNSVREGVIKATPGMQWVDELKLNKGATTHESLGSVAAYLAIGRYAHLAPVAAEQFIRNLNQAQFTARSQPDQAVAAFRQFHLTKAENNALGCGGNVGSIRNRALAAFLAYAGISVKGLPITDEASVEDFGRAMERLAKAA